MTFLILAFAVSMMLTVLAVRASRSHGRLTNDHDLSGPQKFHALPVPRVGGVGIFGGLLACLGVVEFMLAKEARELGEGLLLCGAPAFLIGLSEDLTKRVSPRWRLIVTAASAAMAVLTLDAVISRTQIPGLDWLVLFPWVAAVITVFVVAGVANSINIIDGFNGLSSMCVMLILLGIAYVAHQVGDHAIFLWALATFGAVAGFFVWNFPRGLIFLGDGGAYFSGFVVAELAILLLHRHPAVSPMFPLLACIYPVVETLFSIYRRRFLKDVSPGLPDGIHLHSLIYRRLVRWPHGGSEARMLTRRNSFTAPYLWVLCMLSVIPAALFWNNSLVLATFIALFSVSYVTLYWRIVRFKSPRWMIFRR
jgi:UDP-N-acetylmuramyl pentapeptide phosphotransferase/UDP-N-acetylglucosamine-1-phosphate transferase